MAIAKAPPAWGGGAWPAIMAANRAFRVALPWTNCPPPATLPTSTNWNGTFPASSTFQVLSGVARRGGRFRGLAVSPDFA
jgi:hypothetical protein